MLDFTKRLLLLVHLVVPVWDEPAGVWVVESAIVVVSAACLSNLPVAPSLVESVVFSRSRLHGRAR